MKTFLNLFRTIGIANPSSRALLNKELPYKTYFYVQVQNKLCDIMIAKLEELKAQLTIIYGDPSTKRHAKICPCRVCESYRDMKNESELNALENQSPE